MYILKKYSTKNMLFWTAREIRFFVIWSTIVVILFDIVGLGWLQIPWTPLAMIGTAVAFLIGFQSNAAYGRIWEARKIWGGIVNDSRMFAIMAIDMISNEHAKVPLGDTDLKDLKRNVLYRHIAWLTALRYAMRAERPWESNKKAKSNRAWNDLLYIPEYKTPLDEELKELLAPDELQHVLSKKNIQTAVLKSQSSYLKNLKEKGYIWEFSFLELENKISDLITHQGKSERIKNFPYPRQFATIGYDFVNLFILVIPFGIIPEFSRLGMKFVEQYPVVGEYFAWFGVPFTALVAWVFNTMQRIGTVGENPFEGSVNDVPISTISNGIEIDLRQMLDEQDDQLPDPIPTRLDAQM
ncbi:MAG: bestrophin family protein [Cyclobacteriaceae bacterium]